MKKLREIRTKIDAYIQTHKPAAFIMWLLVLLFPLWLSLSGNAISFLSGEDGAAAAHAFNGKLRGVPVRDASDLSFLRGDGLPLEARSPGSAFDRLNIYDYADG